MSRGLNHPLQSAMLLEALESRQLLALPYTLTPDIEFARVAGQSLRLDLYRPTGASGATPVLMFVHGGGWSSGDKSEGLAAAELFAAAGYTVVSVNYRYAKAFPWPAQVQDVKGAVRFLRAHAAQYQLDPNRFAVWGESAGAQIAAIVGSAGDVSTARFGSLNVDVEGNVGGNLEFSSRVQAVVDWFGPTDLLHAHDYDPAADLPGSTKSTLVGGPLQLNAERALSASPIQYLTPDDPPVLIMHGTADTVVPFNQSELFYNGLRDAGVPALFHPVEGAGHSSGLFGGAESASKLRSRVLSFVNEQLGARINTVAVDATDSYSAEAGPNRGRFTISRTGSLRRALTLRIILDGTAVNGADYAVTAQSITIPAGQAAVSVSIVPMDDAVPEGSETVRLMLAESSAYRTEQSKHIASIRIADNENLAPVPIVTIAAPDARASEAGADQGSFTISRTGSTAAPLTVRLRRLGAASAGLDYIALSKYVTIPAGSNSTTVPVVPIDDPLMESSELVVAAVNESVNYIVGAAGSAGVTITDNEPIVAKANLVTVTASEAIAAENGRTSGGFFIARSTMAGALKVNFSLTGSAAAGSDYAAPAKSVLFADGQQFARVMIQALQDSRREGGETVILTLLAGRDHTIGNPFSAAVTITDDD